LQVALGFLFFVFHISLLATPRYQRWLF
jgi:hypothetical protein